MAEEVGPKPPTKPSKDNNDFAHDTRRRPKLPKASALTGHVDFVDLAERVMQGVVVENENDEDKT